jgi:hypothetical protein
MSSVRKSLPVLLGVSLLSVCFASGARAGAFPAPFMDESMCGNVNVAATMATASSYSGVPNCSSLCRAGSAQCHRFVVRVASCDTAFAVSNAVFAVRNCNEIADPVTRIACRVSVKAGLITERTAIVADRDTAFTDCDAWESTCMAACPVP